MHGKDIKARIRKQLKTQFPNWHRLTRKEKKGIARQVLEQVIENYDFPKEVATPIPELIGLSDQQPTQAIMTIKQMSQFRSSLSFAQMINLNVYFLYLRQNKGLLDAFNVHFVDSTELAVDRQHLLAKFKIGNQNIRIYDDIDCDCGKRRNKRDKSI